MRNLSPYRLFPSGWLRPVALLALGLFPLAGRAQFSAVTAFSTGPNSRPVGLVAADVNGDGKLDMLTANYDSSEGGVLLNTTPIGATAPTFAPVATFSVGFGTSPYSVAAPDVDGDGKPDLITANVTPNTVTVLRNTTLMGATTPTFAPLVTFSTGPGTSPYRLVTADVNSDGKPDLVLANLNSTAGVLLNTTPVGGTLSFAPVVTFPTGSGSVNYGIGTGDVNGDGKPDLLTADVSGNAAGILLNTTPVGATTPTFAPLVTFSTGFSSSPYSITAGDVNSDGKLDLLVASNSDAAVVLRNTTPPGGTLSFAPAVTFAVAAYSYPNSITTADVNGDGKLDMLMANRGGSTASVLLNVTPAGGTLSFIAYTNSTGSYSFPYVIAAADVNGDGKSDLLTANSATNTAAVLLNQYNFPAPTLTALSPASGPVGTIITLTGTNLANTTTVNFNGMAATSFLVGSATSLTAVVPVGAMSGPVTVTTGGGTATGPTFTVTAATAPIVTTALPTTLTSTGAMLGGTVTTDGGASITERGVVYVAGPGPPTIANTKVAIGTGIGIFAQAITGLTTNTLYSVRAYAINAVGTGYGAVQTFNTPQPLATASAAVLAAGVQLYPNPSTGQVQVHRPTTASAGAVLYNALGQVVRQVALPSLETTLVLTDLPVGIYYLHLLLDGQAVVLPFILN